MYLQLVDILFNRFNTQLNSHPMKSMYFTLISILLFFENKLFVPLFTKGYLGL